MDRLSRRTFFKLGGAAAAGAIFAPRLGFARGTAWAGTTLSQTIVRGARAGQGTPRPTTAWRPAPANRTSSSRTRTSRLSRAGKRRTARRTCTPDADRYPGMLSNDSSSILTVPLFPGGVLVASAWLLPAALAWPKPTNAARPIEMAARFRDSGQEPEMQHLICGVSMALELASLSPPPSERPLTTLRRS